GRSRPPGRRPRPVRQLGQHLGAAPPLPRAGRPAVIRGSARPPDRVRWPRHPRAGRVRPGTLVAFAGFQYELLEFLAGLRAHNDRTWFQAHREEYESLLLEPARDFVEAMGEELARFAPDVNADPRVGGSIFRIARDTRFSKDKRPYKDHLDLWFWQGAGKS